MPKMRIMSTNVPYFLQYFGHLLLCLSLLLIIRTIQNVRSEMWKTNEEWIIKQHTVKMFIVTDNHWVKGTSSSKGKKIS